uniref:Protein LNK1 n=2 Tax=Aegilops tauschii subsp. strangulata TaxID=200361 RepID=A0A453EW37_AEGTS
MFDCNGESQQQVGDGIWAELRENEDHITPCPKDTKDSRSICVRDQKKNDDEAASVVGLTECTSGGQTEHPGLEKQAATEASGHYSAAQLDIESWPDLPLPSTAFDRNYNDYNIASTYLDFNSASSLQKVTRSVSVQLDGESEVFGNENEEKSNNLLDCDWGNIGDFDDFDYLFSNTEALFGNEMIVNGSNFLVTSSDVVVGTVQSIPFPLDARTRLCIRDSLLRLAHSSSQRQIAGDRTSSNKTKRDEDEVSENDASNRRKRSLVKEAETDTNPVDRIVAHLLFHRPCSTVATLAKEEIASSTLMSLEADSKMPGATPGRPSGDQQTAQEMAIQPSV